MDVLTNNLFSANLALTDSSPVDQPTLYGLKGCQDKILTRKGPTDAAHISFNPPRARAPFKKHPDKIIEQINCASKFSA